MTKSTSLKHYVILQLDSFNFLHSITMHRFPLLLPSFSLHILSLIAKGQCMYLEKISGSIKKD